MNSLESAKMRVEAALTTIARLEESEFPYEHAKDGLGEVKAVFKNAAASLAGVENRTDKELVEGACVTALNSLFYYLPFLGFILRSTNVRNAFEVHGPLLRLGQKLLGPEIKLVLSSEWDYSPMTYPGIKRMEDFVLIGFPATESANPFLIPLAGHEMGHNVWRKHGLESKVRSIVLEVIQTEIQENRYENFCNLYGITDLMPNEVWGDMFAQQQIALATTWAIRQSEETFCDFLGLRIFGSSFVHSFVYLLSPGQPFRHVLYPSSRVRVANLMRIASELCLVVPPNYATSFLDDYSPNLSERDSFQLELAEYALEEMIPYLAQTVNAIVESANLELPDATTVREIRDSIDLTIPPERAASLPAIVEAGWEALCDGDLWMSHANLDERAKYDNLAEIILKAIEIYEIESITVKG